MGLGLGWRESPPNPPLFLPGAPPPIALCIQTLVASVGILTERFSHFIWVLLVVASSGALHENK
jgi:hypothetical protein